MIGRSSGMGDANDVVIAATNTTKAEKLVNFMVGRADWKTRSDVA